MAHKKNKGKNANTGHSSPEEYIRKKGRSLTIDKCYINSDWKSSGLANIIVVRKHPKGSFTAGMFLVDNYCRGVCDSFYMFNVESVEINEMIYRMYSQSAGYEEVEYKIVHNLIYGAIEFAGEVDILPCREFATTKYLLEEDNDDIEFIQYEYGKDGKYLLSVPDFQTAAKYLPKLKKNLGDDFLFECGGFDGFDESCSDDDFYEDDEFDEEEDDCDDIGDDVENYDKFDKRFLQMMLNQMSRTGLEHRYEYNDRPEYQRTLALKHDIIRELLCNPDKEILSPDEIKAVTSLPKQEVKEDLENLISYVTGLWHQEPDAGTVADEDRYCLTLSHAVMLLAEVGDIESLDTIFEILRQESGFIDYHFGDVGYDFIPPTLYILGRKNPRKLFDFLKEPGREPYNRDFAAAAAIKYTVHYEPERRNEVISYCREFIDFLICHGKDPLYMSGPFSAMLTDSLCYIGATELRDEIRKLYDTGNVDETLLGDFNEVSKYLNEGLEDTPLQSLDINERYAWYAKKFL